MFIKQFSGLREHLLEGYDLRALHDVSSGGFQEISAAQVVVSVVSSVFGRASASPSAVALKSFNDDTVTQVGETDRKRAATLCHVGRHEFDPAALKVVPEWPLVYWWDEQFLALYEAAPKLGALYSSRKGTWTSDNARFLRLPHEVVDSEFHSRSLRQPELATTRWLPYVGGAKGEKWIDTLTEVINWGVSGLELKALLEVKHGVYPQGTDFFFRRGVAFAQIGSTCSARLHRYPGTFGGKGSSVFPSESELARTLCVMNSIVSTQTLSALNPGVGFELGDVSRLALVPMSAATTILDVLNEAFGERERGREPSVEFSTPRASCWVAAQEWAQSAVDRSGEALPPFRPRYDEPSPTEHVSFALGVSLGHFSTDGDDRELLDSASLGLVFLDVSLEANDDRDSLGSSVAKTLNEAWRNCSQDIATKRSSLREYLALDFFKDVHRKMYENRPIHWPLSSAKRTFVAWVNIHRWDENTLRFLLAEHLHKAQARLDGELNDLRIARDGADKKAAGKAEKRYDKVLRWREELAEFVELVTQCAEKGPPPTDAKCPAREVDARYIPDLDDGVMINSAALWPLLEPQWKDPKKWWKELASSKGKKDYDWSHLAMRYWPTRVDAKCKEDPSLGVAHGCFWRYHPARAWAWELRLQDEIAADFRIEEKPYAPQGLSASMTGTDVAADTGDQAHRAAYIANHPAEALAAVEKEALRRRGRGKDAKAILEMTVLERGLWSALPEECWDLEERLTEKQGAEFRLHAPDEEAGRAAFEAAHPERVAARVALVSSLTPAPALFEAKQADGPPEHAPKSIEAVIAGWTSDDLVVSGKEADIYALASVVAASGGIDKQSAHLAARLAHEPELGLPQLGKAHPEARQQVEAILPEMISSDFDWGTAVASLEGAGAVAKVDGRFVPGTEPLAEVPDAWMRRAALALALVDFITIEALAEVIPLRMEVARESARDVGA